MNDPDHYSLPPRPASDADPSLRAAAIDLPRLLREAAAGDEDAWRSIVFLYARRVYALARSRLCSQGVGVKGPSRGRGYSPDGLFVQGHDVAEEVTQSVFVTVAGKLSGGEYTEKGRFESWLFRVAMNRIRDEVRRARRQAVPTDPDVLNTAAGEQRTPGTGAEQPSADELSALRRAMSELTDQDREIVELRHHAGLSFKQMADMLAEPIGTLLARHHRALRKLKELITGQGAHPARAEGDTL